jgi:hypothetical protein
MVIVQVPNISGAHHDPDPERRREQATGVLVRQLTLFLLLL